MEGRNTQALPPSDSNSKINSKINPNTATATTTIDFPAPVVTTPAVAIRNPYVSGKISNNAISKSKSNSNSNNTTTTAAGQSSDAKVRLSTPGITAAAAAATASKTVSSNENHRQNQKQKEQQQQQQQQQEPQQHQQPAYWERLPSRTVSFTPAEVLTVTECLKQDNDGRWSIARLYCEEGRSVRITGILDHRSSVLRHRRRDNNDNDNNDANDDETCADSTMVVVMEVRDPMTTTTQATAERAKAKQQYNSTLVTPATKFKKRRRSSSSKLPTTTTRSALSSKRKKRPWFASSSSSALGSNKATITPAKKNPSTSNTITHTDSASETLRVIVDAKSVVGADQSLAAAVVGSFVTVIGEFVVAATSSSEPALRCYELEARTLRVINHHHVEASASASTSTKATTDMVFYEKALALRRKTMYERYYYASNEMKSKRNGVDNDNDNGNNNDKPMLLQGCGPPPYDVYHRELAVDQSSLGELGKKEPQANTV